MNLSLNLFLFHAWHDEDDLFSLDDVRDDLAEDMRGMLRDARMRSRLRKVTGKTSWRRPRGFAATYHIAVADGEMETLADYLGVHGAPAVEPPGPPLPESVARFAALLT